MSKTTDITCCFCNLSIPGETEADLEAAIDAGWTPSFRIGPRSIDRTYCPACGTAHTSLGSPGDEPELREGHEQYLRDPIQEETPE